MLRITEQNENDQTLRLRLDGTIDATTWAELQSALPQRNTGEGLTVILDMAGVMFMSEEAAGRLTELLGHSLQIVNGSPFIEMLLASASKQ